MTAKFTLWFKTPELWFRLIEEVRQTIPGWFEFEIRIGTPPIVVLSDEDPLWVEFPFPTIPGDVYVFDDPIPAGAAGGGVYDGRGSGRAAARVMPGDTNEVIALRLWHELLHAVDQPADDMHRLADEWLSSAWDRLLWQVWPWFAGSRDVPRWHRRYYAWLTKCAMEAGQ